MKKRTLIFVGISLILLALVAVCIWGEERYPWMHMPRMIGGSFVVLILPGYWITRWTFPLHENARLLDPTSPTIASSGEAAANHTIDGLERFVLSVALSISAVPLILFYINFLWVALSIWSVYWTIVGVTIASIGATLFIEHKHAQHS